ncbi:MACPF domain-containing protein CAD1 [Platanthera guangdongensis]|uniref:MACPF domain-containing protein CAD1 n=1 Tax=Platanthera guangdongensis TaxID=2320717 RepID=A0ABR2M6V6_9ASPA
MGKSWSAVQPKPLAALTTTLSNAVEVLGQGFDITADSRLLYCKGTPGSRLVRLIPFFCGGCDLGDALCFIREGAVMIRTKGEADIENVVEAVLHACSIMSDI